MWEKIKNWIKHPHGWGLALFYLVTAVCIAASMVFMLLLQEKSYSFLGYLFYVFAAITLGYTVYTIVIFVPKIKGKVKEKIQTNAVLNRFLGSYDVKTRLFSLISTGITLGFAVMNLVSFFRYRLMWYITFAGYYFVLILFRGGVLFANKKCAQKFRDNAEVYEKCKWRIYLSGGAFLIVLEFAMAAAITALMIYGRPTESGMIMAIANATYTFYKVGTSIHNLVKAHKVSDPVAQSLRNLNFADACMSIVSLTVLMIATFDGENPTEAMLQVKSAVALAVCAIIIGVATVMIIRASKKLKIEKGEATHGEQ